MSDKKEAGRPKESGNKDRVEIFKKAEELGVDPFVVLLHFVKGDFEALGYEEYSQRLTQSGAIINVLTIDPEVRAKCAMKACEFMYPKKKSVEVSTGDIKGALTLAYGITSKK